MRAYTVEMRRTFFSISLPFFPNCLRPLWPAEELASSSAWNKNGRYDSSWTSASLVYPFSSRRSRQRHTHLDCEPPFRPHASRTSFETSHSPSSFTCALGSSTAWICCDRIAFCINLRFKVPALSVLPEAMMVVRTRTTRRSRPTRRARR